MIEQAWAQYRGWADRARQQQARTQFWNRIAIGMVVVTAFLGTLSAQLNQKSWMIFAITVVSALITAVSGWLGREALAADGETNWVKSRAYAEAVKSECYRFAGRSGVYAVADDAAETAFGDRLIALRSELLDTRLTPVSNPTPGSAERPSAGMDKAWYIKNRLLEQRSYFAKALAKSDKKVSLYRMIALGSMVLGALCSTAAGFTQYPAIAAWTGVITTISAAFVAAGMNERAQAIGAEAARMINQFDDMLLVEKRFTPAALIEKVENLLHEENVAWIQTMKKTREAAAAAAAAAPKNDSAAPDAATPAADAPVDTPAVDGPADGPAGDGGPVEDPNNPPRT